MEGLKKEKGFTLVELLVVLAIIGVLIALAVGGIRIVQEVNRDTQRKALVRDVQLALESYNEKENTYPGAITLDNTDSDCDGGVMITAGTEEVCSSVNFNPGDFQDGSCDTATYYPTGSGIKEESSGHITGCYEGETKAYQLYILLERSEDDYNAGNSSNSPAVP